MRHTNPALLHAAEARRESDALLAGCVNGAFALVRFAPCHFLALLSLLIAAPALASDCAAQLDAALKTDLTLDYQAFDQTEGQGFRKLAAAGCPAEAADLIEAYIAQTGATQSSLVWHVAQLRAEQGDYERARVYALRSLNPDEDLDEYPLRWNDYVHAVIAFLDGDQARLRHHRDQVAAGRDAHAGNGMNVRLLDRLIANFGMSYSAALSAGAKHEP